MIDLLIKSGRIQSIFRRFCTSIIEHTPADNALAPWVTDAVLIIAFFPDLSLFILDVVPCDQILF